MKDAIARGFPTLRAELAEFTRQLISIPTENPPGREYERCIRLIERKLKAFGLDTRIIEVEHPGARSYRRYALLASFGRGRKTVYFHGHYDVVPAEDSCQFVPHVKDGLLWGRGSSDMKGGIAAMIYAVRIMQRYELDLRGTVRIVIVPDEETGGRLGTQYLFEKGHLKRASGLAMFTAEPTSGAIWNASRGALSLRVRIKGKPVHVVMQGQGINAFERMIPLVQALLELKSRVEERETRSVVGPGESRHSVLMLGGRCEGGTSFNIVPGECSFTLDRRINPEEDLKTEKSTIFGLCDRFRTRGIDIEVDVLQEGAPSVSPVDHPAARILASSPAVITGKPPAFRMCPGLLETRFYAQRGIPAFAYGPGLLSASHSRDEFIYLDDISKCAIVYALATARLLVGSRSDKHLDA